MQLANIIRAKFATCVNQSMIVLLQSANTILQHKSTVNKLNIFITLTYQTFHSIVNCHEKIRVQCHEDTYQYVCVSQMFIT